MVVMRVAGIGIDAHRESPLLVLVESQPQGRGRKLPIWVAQPEAIELAAAHEHVHRPRPGTHELILAVLAEGGRRLLRVIITALCGNTYIAELVLDGDTRISARPSDAVILALHADVPIEATEDVLNVAATEHSPVIAFGIGDDVGTGTAARIREFRDFLDTIEPDDFGPG